MNESTSRTVDAVCKVAAVLSFIVGGIWTAGTYFDHRIQEEKTADIEARKSFSAKRQETYFEVISVTGAVINSRSEQEFADGRQKFNTLYYGKMILVEDADVQEEMNRFQDCLNRPKTCNELVTRAIRLAEAFRNSLADTWQVDLPKNSITKDVLEKLRH